MLVSVITCLWKKKMELLLRRGFMILEWWYKVPIRLHVLFCYCSVPTVSFRLLWILFCLSLAFVNLLTKSHNNRNEEAMVVFILHYILFFSVWIYSHQDLRAALLSGPSLILFTLVSIKKGKYKWLFTIKHSTFN